MPVEFQQLLAFGAALCAVMAIVWAFRIKSRGVRAVPMLIAFLVFGSLMLALRAGAPHWSVTGLCVLLFVLIVLDALVRIAHQKGAK